MADLHLKTVPITIITRGNNSLHHGTTDSDVDDSLSKYATIMT